MSYDVFTPELPENSGDIVCRFIHVKRGESVVADQVLAEIETNKVVLEVTSPNNAVVESILVESGEAVSATQSIMQLREPSTLESKQFAALSSSQEKTDRSRNESSLPSADVESINVGLVFFVIAIIIAVGLAIYLF